MPLIIGIDEAGYGPNLGPLVVGASSWSVPPADQPIDLHALLAGAVCRSVDEAKGEPRLPIADSKELYSPGGTLATLEKSVLAAAMLAGHGASNWVEFTNSLDAGDASPDQPPPWNRDFDLPLPTCNSSDEISVAHDSLGQTCDRAGVTLRRIAAAIVQPATFNDLAEKHGNKAALLSRVSLSLAKKLSVLSTQTEVFIYCDKHGGRKRYAGFLQDIFETGLIRVLYETAGESAYRFMHEEREIEIRFTAKGESQLPVALASMTAKYLRELSMQAFNAFWRGHLPAIRPTAGYPQDARRFRAEIAALQQQLGITDHELWRER